MQLLFPDFSTVLECVCKQRYELIPSFPADFSLGFASCVQKSCEVLSTVQGRFPLGSSRVQYTSVGDVVETLLSVSRVCLRVPAPLSTDQTGPGHCCKSDADPQSVNKCFINEKLCDTKVQFGSIKKSQDLLPGIIQDCSVVCSASCRTDKTSTTSQ